MSKCTLNDTYVDVYGLKSWEKPGAIGYMSLERNLCRLDKLRLNNQMERIKAMTEDRRIVLTDITQDEPLTIQVLKKQKETMRNTHTKCDHKKKKSGNRKRKSDVRLSDKQKMLKEKELVGRFHDNSTGKTLGQHAPIPKDISKIKLCQHQHENIESLSSAKAIQKFVYRAASCWDTQWKGKNILFFFQLQINMANLKLHGISARFAGAEEEMLAKEDEKDRRFFIDVFTSYVLDRHGRYYSCIHMRCEAPLEFAKYVVTIHRDNTEEYKEFTTYVKRHDNKDEAMKIMRLFAKCTISNDIRPKLYYHTCTC